MSFSIKVGSDIISVISLSNVWVFKYRLLYVKCEMAAKHIWLQSWKSYNSVNMIIGWLHFLG